MNLFKRIFNATTLQQPVTWLIDMFGNKSSAGISMTDEKGLQIAAVYACVDRLSSGVASLPFVTYRRLDEDVRERAGDFYLHDILCYQPNKWQTAFEFWQWMMLCAVYRGNGYAYKSMGKGRAAGKINALIPIHPDHITVMVYDGGLLEDVAYRYQPPGAEPVTFLKHEILHIKGMPTSHPAVGTSFITAQRETLGGAYATDDQANSHFANGTRLSGIIKVEGKIDQEQSKIVRDEWHEVYGGSSNADKVAVLGSNADFKPISMKAEEAQLLESRKFSRSVIAGLLNVPEHMIGSNEHSTFSNIEHQDIAWTKHSLRPWEVRIEQAARRDLLTERERQQYYCEFMNDSLLRGDSKTRNEVYKIQIETGILSPNEARRKENMNPRPNGDVWLTPLNHRESGPDAAPTDSEQSGDDDPAAAPGNPEAKAELLKETAQRVIARNAGALRKAGKQVLKSKDPTPLVQALDGCDYVFEEVMGSAVRCVVPDADIKDMASRHASGLNDLVTEACQAGDEAITELNKLLDVWELNTLNDLIGELL